LKKSRILIGFVLSAGLFYIFLRNLDFSEIWKTIERGSFMWLFFAVLLNLFNYFMRSLRWRYFLLPIKDTKLSNRFTSTVMGFAASTILPARAGEVVRPVLLGRQENIPKSAALATVVVERLFDTMSILFLLVVYLLVLIKPDELSIQARSLLSDLKKAGLVLFLVVIGFTLLLYYLKTRPTAAKRMLKKLEKILPARFGNSLESMFDSFLEGLSILHDPKILFTITYWSIAFWLVISVGFWCCVKAYVPHFAFTNTFLIILLLAIGISVPTPGAVGSYHLACQLGLTQFFGVPKTLATAVALVSHFITFLPVTILGLVFFSHAGYSATKLQKLAETKE